MCVGCVFQSAPYVLRRLECRSLRRGVEWGYTPEPKGIGPNCGVV